MDGFFPFGRHDRGREQESVSEGREGRATTDQKVSHQIFMGPKRGQSQKHNRTVYRSTQSQQTEENRNFRFFGC
jgi:hypothetical protein